MKSDEAKFILGAYRPNGLDAADPTFAQALWQAQADQELGTWFARSKAHDGALAARLREIAPPAGLREAIFAGGRVSSRSRRLLRLPTWLAIAAAVAVLATLSVMWKAGSRQAGADAFGKFVMADTESGNYPGKGAAYSDLGRWLESGAGKLSAAVIPMDFEKLRTTGCRTVQFFGHDVLELCFERDNRLFHLYAMRRGDLPKAPVSGRPMLVSDDGTSAAVWSDAHFIYAVTTQKGMEALQRVL